MTTPRQIFQDVSTGFSDLGRALLDVNIEQVVDGTIGIAVGAAAFYGVVRAILWVFGRGFRFFVAEARLYRLGRALRSLIRSVTRR